jgi:hypothetical protein
MISFRGLIGYNNKYYNLSITVVLCQFGINYFGIPLTASTTNTQSFEVSTELSVLISV